MASSKEESRKRKINPIYEAIDNGNFKGALKLCLSKDIADWDIALTLRAHCLERLGKCAESLEFCRLVKARAPTDEAVLNALTLTFKLHDLGDEAIEVFETALSLQPGNIGIAEELFFSQARLFRYSKQSQLAMKLFKQAPSAHFVCWSATANLLEARCGESKTMLALGERMLKRSLDARAEKGSKPSAEEFRLFLTILREQGKLQEALRFPFCDTCLRSDSSKLDAAHSRSAVVAHGSCETDPRAASSAEIDDEQSLKRSGVASEFLMMQPVERLEIEARLRSETKDGEGACQIYDKLVRLSIDQCLLAFRSYYVGYFDSLFSESWSGQAILLSEALGWCTHLQTLAPHARAPYLAQLELLSRWIGRDGSQALPAAWKSSEEQSDSAELELGRQVCEYVSRFSSKSCCFMDLKPFLEVISSSETSRISLLCSVNELLERSCPIGQEVLTEKVSLLHKTICLNQCRRFLGHHATCDVPSLKAELAALVSLYQATLDVNQGAKGGDREVQHGDDLLILASHILSDLARHFVTSGDSQAACRCHFDAAVLLEFGRGCSPYNYHYKISLLECYRCLGSFEAGVQLFNELRVKHIQLDSLSWLVLPGCAGCGLFNEVKKQCQEIIRFHRIAKRDAGDHVAKAYEYGNYTRAVELSEFQANKMARSMQLALARSHLLQCELLEMNDVDDVRAYLETVETDKRPECPPFTAEDLPSLSVNHDWSVVLSWENHLQVDTKRRASMEQHLLARYYGPRALLHCLRGSNPDTDIAALRTLVEGGHHLMEEFELRCWHMSVVALEACAFVNLQPGSDEDTYGKCSVLLSDLTGCIAKASPYFSSSASTETSSGTPLSRATLQRICCFLDTCGSYVCLALQVVMAKVAPVVKKSKSKKGKKKVESSEADGQAAVAAHFELTSLIRSIISILKDTSISPASVGTSFALGDCTTSDFASSNFADCRQKVLTHIASSNKLSVERLLPLFIAKLEALGTVE